MYLKIHRGKDKQFYVRLCAANNRILMVSEGYVRRENAVRAAHKLGEALSDVRYVPRDI